jgi:hypothetical protein
MNLIAQYESLLHKFPFEEQYNYTLLLNCLLGLIVLPKERLFTHIPNPIITNELKESMGLKESVINTKIVRLRELIHSLRNSIAHYNFQIVSQTEDFLVDNIVFNRSKEDGGEIVANFKSTELLPFIRYYVDWTKSNIIEYK